MPMNKLERDFACKNSTDLWSLTSTNTDLYNLQRCYQFYEFHNINFVRSSQQSIQLELIVFPHLVNIQL